MSKCVQCKRKIKASMYETGMEEYCECQCSLDMEFNPKLWVKKLTPPQPQNKERRRKFFEDHPELPNAKIELEKIKAQDRIGQLKTAKKRFSNLLRKSRNQSIKTQGAFGRPPEYQIGKVWLEVI